MQLTDFVSYALLTLLVAANCFAQEAESIKDERKLADGQGTEIAGESQPASIGERYPVTKTLDYGKRLIKQQPSECMIPFEHDELPRTLRSTSDVTFPLRKEAKPFESMSPFRLRDGIDASVRVFAAQSEAEDDLIEYRWTHDGLPITVLVGRNGRRIIFDLSEIPECRVAQGPECVEPVKAWVESVIRLKGETPGVQYTPYQVDLPWPTELSKGVWFSSAPEKSLLDIRGIEYWHDRVDALVEDRTLTFLIYKRIGQRQSYQNGSEWFPDDFRAEVHERARRLGRLPATSDKNSLE